MKSYLIYPTMSSGIQITSGASWMLGAPTLIFPANTTDSDYVLHSIIFESFVPSGFPYELVLYDDVDCTNEIERVRVESLIEIQLRPLKRDKTKPIYGKLASTVSGGKVTISLRYRKY
jgi:hypothetical protein